jgi:hypothetical protein
MLYCNEICAQKFGFKITVASLNQVKPNHTLGKYLLSVIFFIFPPGLLSRFHSNIT